MLSLSARKIISINARCEQRPQSAFCRYPEIDQKINLLRRLNGRIIAQTFFFVRVFFIPHTVIISLYKNIPAFQVNKENEMNVCNMCATITCMSVFIHILRRIIKNHPGCFHTQIKTTKNFRFGIQCGSVYILFFPHVFTAKQI